MDNAPLSDKSTLGRRSAGDAEEQRRLGSQAETSNPDSADRRQRTLRALADVDAGRLIDDEAMRAWADSLGTDQEMPVPPH